MLKNKKNECQDKKGVDKRTITDQLWAYSLTLQKFKNGALASKLGTLSG